MPKPGLLASTLAFVCTLAGCATRFESPPAPGAASTGIPVTVIGQSIARTALDMLGTPYRYGGSDPEGFDCSGLVQYAHASHGISLPRTTAHQYRHVRKAPPDLRPGDVLFFRINGRVSHSGIYLGGGRFVHAPSSGKQVSVTRTDNPYFRDRLAGVRRFR